MARGVARWVWAWSVCATIRACPCARVDRNLARHTLDLVAITDIGPGEEITIDYGCELWFEPHD